MLQRLSSFRTRLYIIIIAAGLFVGLIGVFTIKYFEIKKIIVTSKSIGPVYETQIYTDSLYGKNMLFDKKESLARLMINANPLLKSVVIEKDYPDSLKILVEKYTPSTILKVNSGAFLLSREGVIIRKSREISDVELPFINFYQQLNYDQYQIGDQIDFKDILSAIELSIFTVGMGIKVDTVDIGGNDMIVLNSNGVRFIFAASKSINDQEYQLKTLIKQFRLDGREFISLDLRYDKPVVTLK